MLYVKEEGGARAVSALTVSISTQTRYPSSVQSREWWVGHTGAASRTPNLVRGPPPGAIS